MPKSTLSDKKTRLLIFCAAFSAGTLLISNLAAVKLWDFFGIAVDGGIIIFPLTYILGDLIVELFGKKPANTIVLSSFLMNILAVLCFWIVIALPAYESWGLQDSYANVLGFTPRIIFASLTGFILSNLLNNHIFEKLRHHKSKSNSAGLFSKSFIARALGSSLFAHFVDSLIFETLAFFGVLSLPEFIAQAAFAYVAGFLIELILAPAENLIVKKLKCLVAS